MTTPHASIARRLATSLTLAVLGLCVACASPVSPERADGMEDMPRQERERRERALREADKAFRADDPTRAEELYISAIRQYPDFGQAWNNLGVALMAQDRFLEAGEAFDRAAELQPTDPRPPYNRGLLWFQRGYLRDSMPHFLEAIERDPNYLPALRSAIRAAVLLRDTSPETLDHIRTALLIEKDEKWRNYFERQRLLIEANLSAESTGSNESL